MQKCRERSYHAKCTGSRPIPEVKLRRAESVVRWVTACEASVLFAFCRPFALFCYASPPPYEHGVVLAVVLLVLLLSCCGGGAAALFAPAQLCWCATVLVCAECCVAVLLCCCVAVLLCCCVAALLLWSACILITINVVFVDSSRFLRSDSFLF